MMSRLVAIALMLCVGVPSAARASCDDAFRGMSAPDAGDAVSLYQAALSAMRADQMDRAESLLLSSYAKIGGLTGPGRPVLEIQVIARLAEVAVQRRKLEDAYFRMLVLRTRVEQSGARPAWVDKVLRYVDAATTEVPFNIRIEPQYRSCRAFGVAPRLAIRILFDTDSVIIDDAARAQLSRVAANLAADRPNKVIVRGHTDARGTDEHNLALSLRRANVVVALLTVLQPSLAGHLVAEGAGKREPLYPADDDEAYRLNRRVEFSLVARQ
ncbi:OmpA family protein [Sphingomonas aquatica]|uniref:OmpA family protein n=2 Tax=Sphingomonas TaxID=13687 RepID=UPI0009E7F815